MSGEETYPTVPGDQGQPVPVPSLTGSAPNPRVAPANRWFAFTDDEIRDLCEVTENGPILLARQVRAELIRRMDERPELRDAVAERRRA